MASKKRLSDLEKNMTHIIWNLKNRNEKDKLQTRYEKY